MESRTRPGLAHWALPLTVFLSLACADAGQTFEHRGDLLIPQGGADQDEIAPGECRLGALRIGLVPQGGEASPASRFAPLASFLGGTLNATVTFVPYERYDELVDDITRGELDAAQMPPLAFLLARERDRHLQLLATLIENGDVRYAGYLLVRRDSDLLRLRDLERKHIAFTSYASASGFVFPLARLAEEGVAIPEVLARAQMAGTHVRAIEAVVDRRADAAATYRGGLSAARAAGIDTGALRVLGITEAIPQEALVASSHTSSRDADCIRRAFLSAGKATANGRQALAHIPQTDGWTATNERLYDTAREQLKIARTAAPEVAP